MIRENDEKSEVLGNANADNENDTTDSDWNVDELNICILSDKTTRA